MRRSAPSLAPVVVCAMGFFTIMSVFLHWMVSTTLNGDSNLLFKSSDWQLRPTPRQRVGNAKQQKLRQDYENRFPPDMNRTRIFVESLRKHDPQPVTDGQIHYDIYNCPLDPPQGYPFAWNVVDVLNNWNPINETVPDKIYQGLCVFDYEKDHYRAQHYRQLELPFILINTREIWQTAERWNRDDYLLELLGNDGDNKVEHSKNHHFMYWKAKFGVVTPAGWKAPTDMTQLSFPDWLSKATLNATQDWYYFRYNAAWGELHSFLYDELPFFKPFPSFFMVDPHQQRGINCRFGMTGVLAEAHYDSSRNFITVLGGSKRYILAHPKECPHLELYPKDHPSGRHSAVDWTHFSAEEHPVFASAQVNEVVMQAGDALYLPTHWVHFIQSLDLNYQVSLCGSLSLC